MGLCVIFIKNDALLKSADRLFKITHLVEGDSEVEVSLRAVLAVHTVQMITSEVLQIQPDFIISRVLLPFIDQLKSLVLKFTLNQFALPRLFLFRLLRKFILDPLSRAPLFRQQPGLLIHLQIRVALRPVTAAGGMQLLSEQDFSRLV